MTQLFSPFFVLFLLYLTSLNPYFLPDQREIRHPETFTIPPIEPCVVHPSVDEDACYAYGYVVLDPTDTFSHAVEAQIRSMNNLADSDVLDLGPMLPNTSTRAVDDFLFDNRGLFQGVYYFNYSETTQVLDVSVQYNKSIIAEHGLVVDREDTILAPMIDSAYRAAQLVFTGESELSITYDFRQFAHQEIMTATSIETDGASYIFAVFTFNFVIQIGLIVDERQQGLRESMQTFGLSSTVYWLSWFVWNLVIQIANTFVIIAASHLFGMPFVESDFRLYFILFLLTSVAFIPLSFTISGFSHRSEEATSFGLTFYIVGNFIVSSHAIVFSNTFNRAARTVFSLIPFAIFGRGLDLLIQPALIGQRLEWEDREEEGVDIDLAASYRWLIIEFFFYWIITIWYDAAVIRGRGFFLTKKRGLHVSAKQKARCLRNDADLEPGVLSERALATEAAGVLKGQNDGIHVDQPFLVVSGIHKLFQKKKGLCSKHKFHAVRGVDCVGHCGDVLCLLGSNGAGKTTLIKMLTGVHSISNGDAYVYGRSVVDSISSVRNTIGVCPQHDLVFPTLTGRENMRVFGGIKGLVGDELETEIVSLLKAVGLEDRIDVESRYYSGGQRRRLSTATAFIGDPKVVFLDEPSTGLDAMSQRAVWRFVEERKEGRLVILTTHDMSEAEALGDKIMIMKYGQLETVGTTLRLKSLLGAGISIRCRFSDNVINLDSKQDEVRDIIVKHIPVDQLNLSTDRQLVVVDIARGNSAAMSNVLENLTAAKDILGYEDLTLDSVSLESVFLSVTQDFFDETADTRGE